MREWGNLIMKKVSIMFSGVTSWEFQTDDQEFLQRLEEGLLNLDSNAFITFNLGNDVKETVIVNKANINLVKISNVSS